MKQFNKKQRASTRIGPHPKYIYELMIGNLLGDGSLEKRHNSTRFVLSQEGKNQEYLHWLHTQYVLYGYCSEQKPIQYKRITKGNKIRWTLRFRTWSYSSFNWLYNAFYIFPDPCATRFPFFPKKRIPENIAEWLTPLSLAVWFMDDGSVSGNASTGGLKIATNCFTKCDLQRVQKVLQTKFHVGCCLQLAKKNSYQYVLAFGQKDATRFAQHILPWVHPSMQYKLRFVRSLSDGSVL